jgi:hypothetical protein
MNHKLELKKYYTKNTSLDVSSKSKFWNSNILDRLNNLIQKLLNDDIKPDNNIKNDFKIYNLDDLILTEFIDSKKNVISYKTSYRNIICKIIVHKYLDKTSKFIFKSDDLYLKKIKNSNKKIFKFYEKKYINWNNLREIETLHLKYCSDCKENNISNVNNFIEEFGIPISIILQKK